MSAIQAAETGIDFTQVANSRIALSFDYRKRERFPSGKGTREVLYTELDSSGGQTFYRYSGLFVADTYYPFTSFFYNTATDRRS